MDEEAVEELLPLTPVVFHILVALSEEVRHGYEVAQVVEDATDGTVKMGPGTLYGSLGRMQDDGLIAEADDPGREGAHAGRRRYYRITPRGRAALAADTERLARAVRIARSALGGTGG